MEKVKIIAHRGVPLEAPENSRASFAAAVKMGAETIEMDLRMTKDGQLIVMHDDSIDRMTNGRGRVAAMTLVDIHTYTLPNGEKVPTVDEVVDNFRGQVKFVFDLKVIEAVEGLLDLVESRDISTETVFSAFNGEIIRRIEEVDQNYQTAIACWLVTKRLIDYAAKNGVEYLHPYYRFLTKGRVKLAQEAGLGVNPWTLVYRRDIQRMMSYGVDGLITGRPDLVRRMTREE